jgi:hypothetical protein
MERTSYLRQTTVVVEPRGPEDEESLRIDVDESRSVMGLLLRPPRARACHVFGRGAGPGMTHRFMVDVADGLADGEIATLICGRAVKCGRSLRRAGDPELPLLLSFGTGYTDNLAPAFCFFIDEARERDR